jgi:adenylate kinase
MLRDAVSRKTPVGVEARAQIEAGFLVSDRVMIALVRDRISHADAAHGFVLDGFPRTVPQAEALDVTLADRGTPLDVTLLLEVPEDELVKRMSGRRECPICLRAYNVFSAPSKDGIHCDDHAAAILRQRPDDVPDTVRRRIGVYREQTEPLVDYYRRQEKLAEVSGNGSMDQVQVALRDALERDGTRI